MKHIFLFLIISLFLHLDLSATIRTVSNNPDNLAQYNTIQSAVNASSSGDTILVHGSPTRYAAFTITDKRLTIIGPGWAPLQDFMAYRATVDGMSIIGVNCRHTEIQGMDFFLPVSINTSHPDSLRFFRNRFQTAFYLGNAGTYRGYVFQGNWFDLGWMSVGAGITLANFLFQNNIFYGNTSNGNFYGFTNCQNVLFDHNLWYGPAGTGTAACFGNASKNLLFTNNIFVHRNAATNVTLSVFNNNITFGAGVNNPWDAAYGNSNGGGNIENQDPMMADQSQVNAGTANPLLNFTIASGPANNSGSDGKDMGLLFDATGSLNWANSRLSRIPFVFSMNLATPTVVPGGTLQVQVEARSSN
ncbi:MAG TPA: hypothetical protein VFZ78_11035 [Flavisolibacter sp.]